MTAVLDEEPRALVRSFSSDLEGRANGPQGRLQHVLIDECTSEQRQEAEDRNWRIYFEPWQPGSQELQDAFLRKEGVMLSKAWKAFRDKLPDCDRAAFARRAPSVTDVIETVEDIGAEWECSRRKGKWGLAKGYFHKVAGGFNSHATLLELLPTGSEYVSLFSGATKSIMKASANHEKIAQGLGKALSEITDVVGTCTRVCQLYNTEAIQMLIAKLYAHIFLFLKDAMSWYLDKQWKRVLHALREDFFDDFKDQIANISIIAGQVEHQARMGISAEQRTTRLVAEKTQTTAVQTQAAVDDLRLFAIGQARATAELVAQVQRIESRASQEGQRKELLMLEEPERLKSLTSFIATHIMDLLEGQAEDWLEQKRAAITTPDRSVRQLEDVPQRLLLGDAKIELKLPGRDEYLDASRDLEEYILYHDIRGPHETSPSVSVDTEVSIRLQNFITDADEKLLGIAGPPHLDQEGMSTMTKVAVSFVDFAEKTRLPVVSYFCQLPEGSERQSGMGREVQELISLVYSLIRQLIQWLPLRPQDPINLSIANLEQLDGTDGSLNLALDIVRNLMAEIDTILFVVIDGLQWLDDHDTDKPLTRFIETLLNISEPENRIKVLLTTTGKSRALLDVLPDEQYLLADEGGARRRGLAGRPLDW
ncbi:hypothetical protein B0A48_05374 [Cryoendolithus antarcticus]|uniref:DUF7708 domain-containing protein n=1 Tax=Cryoendolithus antarcticus TaxID=1507870 RepID=A0A1V8TIB3_9PEZI|nr:hypothetical protein B0A48_05374 [Cryoendolithus antarcticus]